MVFAQQDMRINTENIFLKSLSYKNLMRDKIYLVLLFAFVFVGSSTLLASHLTGSTITYECLGGSIYRVHLHQYADCQGIAPTAPASFGVVGTVPGCTAPTATAWTLLSSNEVTYLATQFGTQCGPGPYPGVRDYHFIRDYNFSAVNCSKYKLTWTSCCRNGSNNSIANASAVGMTVVTDTIDLNLPGCNSSPVWHNAPPRLATAQHANYFDLGATDADGDSLVYNFAYPLDGNGNPVAYNFGYGLANPLGNNWQARLDPETGLLSLIPTGSPVTATIAIRVIEYRNGVRIGSVLRDFEILGLQALPGSSNLPTISGPFNLTGAVIVGNEIFVQPGGSVCMDFSASDADPGLATQLSWMSDLNGATLTDTFGNGPDTVLAVGPWVRVCWTAPLALTIDTLTITAIDTALQLNNMVVAQYAFRVIDTVLVWPGDADNNLIADVFDLLPIGLAFGSTGTLRPAASNTWVGQSSTPWLDTIPGGLDKKFIDCDGNGLIDNDDTLAITLNYGLTHTKGNIPVARGAAVDPVFKLILPSSANVGDTIWAPIMLGDATVNANDVYGYAFRLHYDASLIDSSSFWIDFDNSWVAVGGNAIDMSRNHPTLNLCDAAQVRTTQTTVSGMGQVGRAHFVIIDNIDGKRAAVDSATLHIDFIDVRVIGLNGETITVDALSDSMTVYQSSVDFSHPAPAATIELYPNPAHDRVTVKVLGQDIEQVEVLNLQGQLLMSKPAQQSHRMTLDMRDLAQGMYFVRVKTQGNWTVQRIILE